MGDGDANKQKTLANADKKNRIDLGGTSDGKITRTHGCSCYVVAEQVVVVNMVMTVK